MERYSSLEVKRSLHMRGVRQGESRTRAAILHSCFHRDGRTSCPLVTERGALKLSNGLTATQGFPAPLTVFVGTVTVFHQAFFWWTVKVCSLLSSIQQWVLLFMLHFDMQWISLYMPFIQLWVNLLYRGDWLFSHCHLTSLPLVFTVSHKCGKNS